MPNQQYPQANVPIDMPLNIGWYSRLQVKINVNLYFFINRYNYGFYYAVTVWKMTAKAKFIDLSL